MGVRWYEHVPRGLERTTKEQVASAPSAMKIKVVAPPDLGANASVARKCCSSRKKFNLYMHANLAFFVRQVGCLVTCGMRSLESYLAHRHGKGVVAAGVHPATVLLHI